MASLKDQVVFITGATRGIGKAIGMRAARDGAKIVVVGKTDQPHPKLPGTVLTSVAEMKAVGGDAIGCIADIRDEEQITKCGWTPWHGETVTGWPVATFVGGRQVWSAGGGFDDSQRGAKLAFDHSRGGFWATPDGIGVL